MHGRVRTPLTFPTDLNPMTHLVLTFRSLVFSGSLIVAFFFAFIREIHAENALLNPGFETDKAEWNLFVAPESVDKNCKFRIAGAHPHSGRNCAEVVSEDFARLGIIPSRSIFVTAGERYRVSAWIRADAGAEIKPGSPGVLIRLTLRHGKEDAAGKPAIFIGLNGNVAILSLKTPVALPGLATELPSDWTKLEAVVEIPAINDGVDSLVLGVFGQYTKGTFYIDDVSLEKVSESTPLSPVVERRF